MANHRRNYGFDPATSFTAGVIIALAIGVPLFLFGLASVVRAITWMFSKPVAGAVPMWVIVVFGIMILIYLKRRRF